MAVAFDVRKRRDYVLVRDRELPEDKRTTFILRQLDVLERVRVADMKGVGLSPAAMALEMLRLSLDGWRNYPMPDGSEAPFVKGSNGYADDNTLRCVSDADAAELLAETLRAEEVTAKQAGES